MQITVNGERREVPDGSTVAGLLADRSSDGLAVARNGEVVPRSTHARVVLVDGDVVEIVEAVQGG